MLNIFKWGVGGFVLGSAYCAVESGITDKLGATPLHPKTVYLYKDPELFRLFCSLQRYRYISESDFRNAVDFSDRLVGKKDASTVRDRITAFLYFKHVTTNLERFVEGASDHSAKTAVAVHSIYVKILDRVTRMWEGILKQTQY
jgi:hypothetical protein